MCIRDSDTSEGGLADFIPQDIDPNDPLASMFEYEEEDPFASESETVEDLNADAASVDEFTLEDSNEILIGFTRLYSGTLKVGQQISVLGPKYLSLIHI